MKYKFSFVNEDLDKVVAECYVDMQLTTTEAHAVVLDKQNAPIEFVLCKKLDNTDCVIYILKTRVLPPNRMFLDKALEPYGISVDDWIGKMRLNHGRTYADNCRVDIEEICK